MEFCSVNKYEDLIGQENKIIPYLMSLRVPKILYHGTTMLSWSFIKQNGLINLMAINKSNGIVLSVLKDG
jgi:hypothetical protein